ncbi:MAG: DUF441 domain-containing protein [Tissierellia bacterium]|nr:DUF441 domain-containing protein [Tissierellia bacterium]
MNNKIILISIIIISSLAKNKPMVFASITVLIISFLFKDYNLRLDKNIFLNGGMTLLMIWLLMPLVETRYELSFLDIKDYVNIKGIISLLSGFFVVIIAAKGLKLANSNPFILAGVLTGSIIGVTFFGGIPVGILTGSGIAYLIIKILERL